MNSYRVIVTETAEGEIDVATERLLLRSPEAARSFQEGMDKAIFSLREMPRRCPLAREDGILDRPLRQLLYRHGSTTWRILFTIFEETEEMSAYVRILRVRHGAQQLLNADREDSDEE